MPGTHIAGVAVRHGCTLLALDLMTSDVSGTAGPTASLVFALSQALVACEADKHLQDKSALMSQVRPKQSVCMPVGCKFGCWVYA